MRNLFQILNLRRRGQKVLVRTPLDRQYRTRLCEAAARPADFASNHVMAAIGCGMECELYAAIDKQTGCVTWMPFYISGWVQQAEREGEHRPLRYSLTSNRVTAIGTMFFHEDSHREVGPQTWKLIGSGFVREGERATP